MRLVRKKLTELVHAIYNPRKKLTPEDAEYQKIKNSIEQFGYVQPIIVNADNTIIGGHQRATVLEDLGHFEVDCIMVDFDKTKEKALNIALNKIAGEWDMPKLKDLLEELDNGDFNVELTGFDHGEIEYLMTKNADVDIDDFFTEKGEGKPKESDIITCPHCGEEFEA